MPKGNSQDQKSYFVLSMLSNERTDAFARLVPLQTVVIESLTKLVRLKSGITSHYSRVFGPPSTNLFSSEMTNNIRGLDSIQLAKDSPTLR